LPGAEIGLSTIELWTHWYFFEYHNGSYDYSNLDVDKFTDYLMNIPEHMEDRLFTFDIENDYYVNTPEGRDRFAEVLALANQIRPDLDVGMYMFLPERNWHQPVKWMRTLDHLEAGLNSWFTLRADQFEQEFQQWHERNEWYRTEPVSSQYGGTPLADMVDTIYASLYTFYRNDPADPYWRYAEVDANLNTFTIDGPSFDTVEVVRLMVTAGGSLNNGLAQWTDYYVVNASGDTFQLAATPGGTPIDFSGNFTGNIHVGAKGPYWENMWHDPNVIYWKDYAEQNIAEAQKFGKPVYAWISTSIQGIGSELLEPDFLRWQLEILRPLVDGVVLYDMAGRDAAGHMQHGWWTALEDFMGTLDTPAASFTITIPAAAVEVPGPQPNPDPISPPPAPLPPPSPVAVADQFSISGGQPFTFSASALLNNDLNLGVNGAAVTMVANTTHGDLHQISTNLWRYTPDDAFSGIDSFSYRIYNGQVYSDAAVVQIHVQQPVATPSAPQARPDQLEGTEDRPLHFRVADLLSNDLAVNHAQMSFSLVTGPANGTLSRHADGSMIYRPDGNYHGPDQFVYALRSNANGQVISSAMVSIGIDEVNDRPVAVADRLVTREDTPLVFSLNQLLANDIDIESDSLQVEIVQGTQRGQLIDLGHGQYRYVPAANFFGEDQFQYRVYDGSQYSLTTVVAIDVQPINDAPIAREDRFELNEDSSLVLTDQQLLANDTDVDSSQLVLELVEGPAFGTLRRTLQGALVYTPNANFHGSDRFGYRVADGHAVSEIVAVHLTVNPVNDAPIVVDESYSVKAGTVLTVGDGGVLANDRDVDGHAIRAKLLTAPRFGSVTLADDGSFSYRPAPGFSGNDGFEYRVIDVAGGVSIGAARIRVEGVTTPEPILKPILPQVAPQFVLVETNQILTGTKSQSPMFGARVGTSSEDEREQDALLIPL
jgi:hypothetical protein